MYHSTSYSKDPPPVVNVVVFAEVHHQYIQDVASSIPVRSDFRCLTNAESGSCYGEELLTSRTSRWPAGRVSNCGIVVIGENE